MNPLTLLAFNELAVDTGVSKNDEFCMKNEEFVSKSHKTRHFALQMMNLAEPVR